MIYKTSSANIISSDYPDLDVIRVNNTYYMVSTTMHFMPGCVILRSYNLLDWEFCTYVYDELDCTSAQKLSDNKGIYGKGMWAATLRYHKNKFYIIFVANDTHKTYLFTSSEITGPWEKNEIQGFYHDVSLFFEEDDTPYLIYGNTDIHITEMEKNLLKPKENGLNKIIISDNRDEIILGYEGCHFYKINGKYYGFFIHMPKGKMRTEACFVSDKIDGNYTGGDVLCSDLNNWNSGVAQGGIVQSSDGKWYGVLFQDHGALGRIPVLVPVDFNNEFPVFGENSIAVKECRVMDNNPDYEYAPLYGNNFLDKNGKLNSWWQWNHIPEKKLISFKENEFSITTDKTVKNVVQATNTLTQRTFSEECGATVEMDVSDLEEGDYAGFCALEGEYGFIGLTKKDGKIKLVTASHSIPYSPWTMNVYDDDLPDILYEENFTSSKIKLKMDFSLHYNSEQVVFSYFNNEKNEFVSVGNPVKLRYTLDQFVGVRFALFCYSTKNCGGRAVFKNFEIYVNKDL